jgi:Ca2+-binding EF-hand superfamily protein
MLFLRPAFRPNGNCEGLDMKTPVKAIGFAVALGIACTVSQTLAASGTASLQALDSDHDGTIDLNEIRAAAGAAFDRLDRDHDGTLSGRELKGRLSARELAAADGDHDGTLTKDEYAAAVEKRFEAANSDGDGTLDAGELRSRSGKALQRLVK